MILEGAAGTDHGVVGPTLVELVLAIQERSLEIVEELGDKQPQDPRDLAAILLLSARSQSGANLSDRDWHVSTACTSKLVYLGFLDLDFSRRSSRLALLGAVAPLAGFTQTMSDKVIIDALGRIDVSSGEARQILDQGRRRVEQLWKRLEDRRVQLGKRAEEIGKELGKLLPSDLELAPHQLEAVAKIEARGFKAILGDDRGLGKTVECLGTVLLHGEGAFPLLVVGPSSMVGTWAWEARRWLARVAPRVVIDEDLAREPAEERRLKKELNRLRAHLKKHGVEDGVVVEAVKSLDHRYPTAMRYCAVKLEEGKLVFRADSPRKEGVLGFGQVHERLVERLVDDVAMVADRVQSGRLVQADAIRRVAASVGEGHTEALRFCDVIFDDDMVPRVRVDATRRAEWLKLPLVVCVSWTRMLMGLGMLNRIRFGGIIGDEAHEALRVHDSSASKAFLTLRHGANVVLPSTGTLTPNGRHSEAYIPLKAVGAPVGKFWQYGQRYCGPQLQWIGGGRKITQYKGRSDEVGFATLRAFYGLARKKGEISSDFLPPKVRHKVIVNLTSREQLLMAVEKDRVRGELTRRGQELRCELSTQPHMTPEAIEERVQRILRAETVTVLMALRIQIGLIKADRSVALVRELLAAGERPIMVCAHQAVVTRARRLYAKLVGTDDVMIASSNVSSARNRKALTNAWQRGEGKIMILTRAFGSGVTLTSSRIEVFLERFWEPGVEDQIEDRIHRMSQTQDVDLYYPHCPGTPDDVVAELSTWKTRGAEASVGSISERAMVWLGLEI